MEQKNKRETGFKYEQAIGYYLEQEGYEIVQYNYRTRRGEIDIIAKDGEYLVFLEVKYRQNGMLGGALGAVTPNKQKRIWQCALHYITTNCIHHVSCRFDVIGIENGKIQHVKNAFECR